MHSDNKEIFSRVPDQANGVTPLEYTGSHRTSVRLNSLTPQELAVPNLTGKRLNDVTPSEYVICVLQVVIDLVHVFVNKIKNYKTVCPEIFYLKFCLCIPIFLYFIQIKENFQFVVQNQPSLISVGRNNFHC